MCKTCQKSIRKTSTRALLPKIIIAMEEKDSTLHICYGKTRRQQHTIWLCKAKTLFYRFTREHHRCSQCKSSPWKVSLKKFSSRAQNCIYMWTIVKNTHTDRLSQNVKWEYSWIVYMDFQRSTFFPSGPLYSCRATTQFFYEEAKALFCTNNQHSNIPHN